jgi:hypothetical protein
MLLSYKQTNDALEKFSQEWFQDKAYDVSDNKTFCNGFLGVGVAPHNCGVHFKAGQDYRAKHDNQTSIFPRD